jgi:hypothetical protein
MSKTAMKIEMVDIEALIPYARNARTHSEQQVTQIAASIREFGFNNPVLIDGQTTIIAGHGRVLGAKKLGLDRVPCIRLTHMTDAQRRAYILADNRIALNSGWDDAMLALELQGLETDGLDLGLIGFDEAELQKLLQGMDLPAEQINEDEIPEVPVDPVTKPGDLWTLGKHRLLCGDSTKAEDVARLMAGGTYELLMIDPPYGIDASSMTMGSAQSSLPKKSRLSNVPTWDKSRPKIDHLITKKACVWGGNYFAHDLPISDDWLCWHKKNDGLSFGEFELAWCNYGCRTRHLQHHWGAEKKEHITQKPIQVITWGINLSETKGAIADMFCGSGTTLIAAEQLGRKCYGMEISPQYCDVIVNRWETLTGSTATRESTP